MSDGVERRLVAIVAADVAEYSCLVREDIEVRDPNEGDR